MEISKNNNNIKPNTNNNTGFKRKSFGDNSVNLAELNQKIRNSTDKISSHSFISPSQNKNYNNFINRDLEENDNDNDNDNFNNENNPFRYSNNNKSKEYEIKNNNYNNNNYNEAKKEN